MKRKEHPVQTFYRNLDDKFLKEHKIYLREVTAGIERRQARERAEAKS